MGMQLIGGDRLLPALLRSEGVAEVEGGDGVAQVGGAAEAPLGVGLPAGVGQVAAQVDQRVGVGVGLPGGLKPPEARIQVLGHGADDRGPSAPARLPSG